MLSSIRYILYSVSFVTYVHDVMSYMGSCNYHSVRKSCDNNVTERLLITCFNLSHVLVATPAGVLFKIIFH